jgi:hypothetical protein
MNHPFPERDELRALLDALCEETIRAEQLRRLEALVLSRPEAEAFYVEYLRLHADLCLRFAGLPSAGAAPFLGRLGAAADVRRPPLGTPPRSFWLRGLLGLSGLAAALLLALVLMRPFWDVPVPVFDAEDGQVDDTVAVLLQAPEAKWANPATPMRAGTPLPPGRLRLESGLAQIEFYSGAIVLLQGPADLDIISPMEAYCTRGKLRVTVPLQAQGFTVGSPHADLVDRGTEFGLQVGAGAETEVHVFQGKVELYQTGAARAAAAGRELTTGQGVRLDGPGNVNPIRTDPSAFATAADLRERLAEATRRRQQEWRAADKALRRDPSVLVYYSFQAEPPWSRTLHDQAGGRPQPHDGSIVGCAWVAGRWPGRHALEFKRFSDRVRLHVPDPLDSLTLMAWARVDSLPNGNNALLLSDGWKEGAVHWQIGQTGTLILGVRAPAKQPNAHYHAPMVFTHERFGQWLHLAVVYDRAAGLVTHYVDGQPAAEAPIQFNIPLRISDAEIGNWNVPVRRDNSHLRYLNGCVDEFLAFSRALGRDEVAQLYEQGRPPQ